MQTLRRTPKRSNRTREGRFRRWLRHPFGLPVAVFFGLLAVGGGALAVAFTNRTATFRPSSSYIAIISYDQETQVVPTKEQTVGELLDKLDIPLGKRDRVEPSPDTVIVQDNFRINIYRALPVTITDGSETVTAYSSAGTPRGVVTDADLPLYPEDGVTVRPAQNLLAEQSVGERIEIERSVPVTLNDYGTMLSLRTHAKTVAELLQNKGIKLEPQDAVVPALSTPITPHLQVFVTRKDTQIVAETQTIPAPVQTVMDSSLSFGTTAVRQQGSSGTQVLTYQINTENGVEVGRTLLQTVVTVQPVPQIIAKGRAVSIPADKQAVMHQAGLTVNDYPYADFIISHESGWCPTKWQGQVGYCPQYYAEKYPGAETNTRTGYGLCQSTPAIKMASAGDDWRTSAVTQLRWCSSYARARYGSWEAAYNHWVSHHNW